MIRSESPQTPHREVLVKVNAYVDERIAPLVQLLNSIDGMTTWDSCEGEPLQNRATLCLCPGRLGQVPINKVKAFARDLSKALADGGCRRSKVQLDWSDMKTFAWILLTIPQDEIISVHKTLGKQQAFFGSKDHRQPIAHPNSQQKGRR